MNINIPLNVKIYPSKANGTVTVPSSKSLAHRAIILASLSHGESTITNFNGSSDLYATIECMRALGASITEDNSTLKIKGIEDYTKVNSNILDANESASTLRFIIPLLEKFNRLFVIKGKESLFVRPMEVYENLFKLSSSKFELDIDSCTLLVKPKLINKPIHLDGSISSQFITGLLLYLPIRNENSKLVIENLVSYDYFLLTIEMLKKFGATVSYETVGTTTLVNIEGGTEYKPCTYDIEGDYSQLANFLVLGTINNDIKVKGLTFDSYQGDKRLLNIFPNAKYEDGMYLISKYKQENLSFDMKHNPDLGPILMAYFALTGGRIDNVNRLVYKESNRVASMIEELKKLNVHISLVNDSVFIEKIDCIDVSDVVLDSHNDHRIFMALSLLATISKHPIVIKNARSVRKSYPKFIEDLKSLGIKIDEEL